MKRIRGRPRINPDEITEPVATAMAPTLRKAMEGHALKKGRTLSRQVSYACERYMRALELEEIMGIS